MSFPSVTVQRIEEFQLDQTANGAISELLQLCFPGYPQDRTFYKQLPDFRFLVWCEAKLVAHMAVEHRNISNKGELYRIFGIADLCVHPEYQHRQLASRLIMEIETLGKIYGVDFIVLVAKEFGFYESHGFQQVNNPCQWVLIHKHETFGVARRQIELGLVIKALGSREWKEGRVDLLGHIF